MTITNPAPAALAVATISTDSGDVTVPCEPVNEWIAITPVFGMDHEGRSWLDGRFIVTHLPTGMSLVEGPGCINCCRNAGRALAATSVDWSVLTRENSAEISKSWPAEVRLVIAEARAVEWVCDAEYCEPTESTNA
jgi:hypothetical protein